MAEEKKKKKPSDPGSEKKQKETKEISKEQKKSQKQEEKKQQQSQSNSSQERKQSPQDQVNSEVDKKQAEANAAVDQKQQEANAAVDQKQQEANQKVDEAQQQANEAVDNAQAEANATVDNAQAEANAAVDNAQAEVNAEIDQTQAEIQAEIDTVQAEMNAQLDIVQGGITDVTGEAKAQIELAKKQLEVVKQQALNTINAVFDLIPIAGFEAGIAAFEEVMNAVGSTLDGLFEQIEDAVEDGAGAADTGVDAGVDALQDGLSTVNNTLDEVYDNTFGAVSGAFEDVSNTFNNLRAKASNLVSSLFGSNVVKYVPSYVIEVDGSRVGGDVEASVIDIQVVDRVDAPSSFSITLSDPQRKYTDSDEFFIGSSITIKMGYKDALEELIDGEVTGMSAHFRQNDADTVTIRGHNKMHRLARGKITESFGISTPFFTLAFTEADVIRQIALENGLIPLVDFFGQRIPFQLQRNESNLEYILRVAKKYNRRVYVDGDMLFVLPMIPKIDPNAIVEWQKSMSEFSAHQSTLGLVTDVTMRGLDRNGGPLTATADSDSVLFRIGGLTMGSSLSKKAFGKGEAIVQDYDATDQSSLDSLAIDYMTEHSMEYIKARGRCQGNMAIRACTLLTVLGVGSNFSGIYYITEARHRITPYFGYETHFNVMRNVSMRMPSIMDIMSSGIVGDLMESTGLDEVARIAGEVKAVYDEVSDTVQAAMDKVKEFADILEEARRRAKEQINAVKKMVLERIRDIKKQIDDFREKIGEYIKQIREMFDQIKKAKDAITEKINRYSEMATRQLTKLQEKITMIENKIQQMRDKLNAEIDEYQKKIDQMIDNVQDEVNKQFDNAQAQANAAFDSAQAGVNAAIDGAQAGANAFLDKAQMAAMSAIDELQANLNEQFDELQKKANDAIDGAQEAAIKELEGKIITAQGYVEKKQAVDDDSSGDDSKKSGDKTSAQDADDGGSSMSSQAAGAATGAAMGLAGDLASGKLTKEQLQAELDAKIEEMKSKITNFEFSLDDLQQMFDVQSALKDSEIGKMVEKFQKKVEEAMAIYKEAKAMIDGLVEAVRDIENRLRELWDRVQEEARKILKEIVDDFIDDAQSQVMAAVPDIDQMENIALSARNNLFQSVKENIPRLKDNILGLVDDMFPEFQSLLVQGPQLFDRAAAFVGDIASLIGPLLGGSGDLKWLSSDNSEIEQAMVGANIKLTAKCEGIPDDEQVSIKMYHNGYTDDKELIKKWDIVKVRNEEVTVDWKVEYVPKPPDPNEENPEYVKPEYVFVLESKKYEVKEESDPIEIKDYIEVELKNPVSGTPMPNAEFTLVFPDGNTEDCTADGNGFLRKENVLPGGYDIKLKKVAGIKTMKWTKDGNDVTEAMVGDKVKMTIEFENIADNEEMNVAIYEKDYDGKNDIIKEFKNPKLKVQDNKIEFEWDVIYVEDNDDRASQQELKTKGYTLPEYVTVVDSDAFGFKVESPVLEVKDWLELELKDEEDNPLADKKFEIISKQGVKLAEGTLDGNGCAKVENVLFSTDYYVILPELSDESYYDGTEN